MGFSYNEGLGRKVVELGYRNFRRESSESGPFYRSVIEGKPKNIGCAFGSAA